MISVIIPHRVGERFDLPIKTLKMQTYQGPLEIIPVEDTEGRGPSWTRNQGAEIARGRYLLLSDNDIHWYSNALEILFEWLEANPEASYSYGAYEMGGRRFCEQEFIPELLKRHNYISTMSLIRRKDFPGFDENLRKLEDWDLYLNLLSQGKVGVYTGRIIFTTAVRPGVTFGKDMKPLPDDVAIRAIRKKWGLE